MHVKETGKFQTIATSTTTVNQRIISLLGYNYDIYILSNYCKQKKLAYFSELTPAKRLQFIDKISGVEESEEILKWLTSERKTFKSNLTILKPMIIRPDLNPDIDLDFDYKSAISDIDLKLNSLTEIYNELNFYKNKIINCPAPVLALDDNTKLYSTMDEAEFNKCIDYLTKLDSINDSIYSIEKSLKDLPVLPRTYSNYTLDQVEELIHTNLLLSLHTLPEDFKISCTSCGEHITLKTIVDAPVSPSTAVNLKDLYNVQEYLKSDCKAKRRDLERTLKTLGKEFETLVSESSYPHLYKESKTSITEYRTKGLKIVARYEEQLAGYESIIESNKEFKDKIDELQDQVDSFFKEQSTLLNTKDSFTRKATEKDIYLERLDVYNKSITKYTDIADKVETLNKLIKKIPSIVSAIKAETIPSINSASSKFLNLMTGGVMTKIEITEDYTLIVDGKDIALKSGGQQDLASLAFRLSLGQSIIKGMLPLFIGDEIDSAGIGEVSSDISDALSTISDNGYQVIIITHSDITNVENVNIIKL